MNMKAIAAAVSIVCLGAPVFAATPGSPEALRENQNAIKAYDAEMKQLSDQKGLTCDLPPSVLADVEARSEGRADSSGVRIAAYPKDFLIARECWKLMSEAARQRLVETLVANDPILKGTWVDGGQGPNGESMYLTAAGPSRRIATALLRSGYALGNYAGARMDDSFQAGADSPYPMIGILVDRPPVEEMILGLVPRMKRRSSLVVGMLDLLRSDEDRGRSWHLEAHDKDSADKLEAIVAPIARLYGAKLTVKSSE